MASLLQIRTGRIRPVAGHLTAYGKDPRQGPVFAGPLGLEGDEVADTRVHGGPDKAIYAYAMCNYAGWAADHPQHAERLIPGGFGENLLIEGLDEATVHIGDKWRIGAALVEVCQPRHPCATLGRWFDDPNMVKAIVRNGRSGWYLRVLDSGDMAPGEIRLESRPEAAWSIAQVLRATYRNPPDRAELNRLARAPGLATGWASRAADMAQSANSVGETR